MLSYIKANIHAITYGLSWALSYFVLQKEKIKFLELFFIGLFIFSWLGAKIFYFFLFAPTFSIKNLIFNFFDGGIVLYGGIFFGLIFIFFLDFSKLFFLEKKILVDLFLISLALGRIGCFLSGCCYGKRIAVFDMKFTYPYPLIEAIFLLLLKKLKISELSNLIFYYAIFRFFNEFFRGDDLTTKGFFSASQIISLIIILCHVIFFRFVGRKKGRITGGAGQSFMIFL